jgi:hypothetical protein
MSLSTKQQLGLTAMAFVVLTLSVILAIFFPTSIPPFSTSLAFLLVCASAGAIIVIADNRRPPDAHRSTFNPSGYFAYSTRLYGTRADLQGKMFDSDDKDPYAWSNQPTDLRIADTSTIGKLLTKEAQRLWHPGFFDSQNIDELTRYIRFLLSENDTIFVGVGMLLSLSEAQQTEIQSIGLLKLGAETEPVYAGDQTLGGLQLTSFYRIMTGTIGKTPSQMVNVSCFLVRQHTEDFPRDYYMMACKTLDKWQQKIADKLESFEFDIPHNAWTMLCGNIAERPPRQRQPFPKSLSRRMNAPPNPVKPPVKKLPGPGVVAATQAATGTATASPTVQAPTVQAPSPAPLAIGRFGFKNFDFLQKMMHGDLASFAYAQTPKPIGQLAKRVDNNVLTNGKQCFYLVSLNPSIEALATIIMVNTSSTNYTITYTSDTGTETVPNVKRGLLRVAGYGYEDLPQPGPSFLNTVLIHLVGWQPDTAKTTYTSTQESAVLSVPNMKRVQDFLEAESIESMNKALIESFGINGFVFLAYSTAKYGSKVTLCLGTRVSLNGLKTGHDASSSIKYYVITPPWKHVDDYLWSSPIASDKSRDNEVAFQLIQPQKNTPITERLVQNNVTVLFGDSAPGVTVLRTRKPGERYNNPPKE